MDELTRGQNTDFVKTNVQSTTDKKGKQVTFTNKLPSQATTNPWNQGASSSQTHNINHVHVGEEAIKTALAISSPRSRKYLPDPHKDHHIHQGLRMEDTPIIVEHDSDSKDEEEQTKAEPNRDTYKPHMPYPQALNRPKAKINESNDHLLEAFKKVTITIPFIECHQAYPILF